MNSDLVTESGDSENERDGESSKGLIASLCVVGLSVLAMPATPYAQQHEDVMFTGDVAPILQRACQVCHRPGSTCPCHCLVMRMTAASCRRPTLRLAFKPTVQVQFANPFRLCAELRAGRRPVLVWPACSRHLAEAQPDLRTRLIPELLQLSHSFAEFG